MRGYCNFFECRVRLECLFVAIRQHPQRVLMSVVLHVPVVSGFGLAPRLRRGSIGHQKFRRRALAFRRRKD